MRRDERRWWDRKFLVHQEGLSDDQLDIAGHSLSRSLSLPPPSSSSSLLLSLSLSLSHIPFPSPSAPPGPLASRRGDRIISEAFARFLPPSPSSVLFLPARPWRVLNNCNWTRSQQLHLQRRARLLSLSPILLLTSSASSRALSLFHPCPLSPFRLRCLPVRAAHFTIHFVHLPFKE